MAKKSLLDGLDERVGFRALRDAFFNREVPRGVNWWYVLGSATMLTALIQGITGIFLTIYYVPSPDHAYESVQYITSSVLFGSFIRGMHHWAASAIVVLALLHMLQVLFFGAYKYPREINWVFGVGLLLVALGLALTGYLLPWDQRAYWGTTVSTEVAGTAPLIGPLIKELARGGLDVGAVTLARFYALHVIFLPLGALLLFAPHLYMVVRQGISNPPERKVRVPDDPAGYKAFYGARKKGGHTFYPHLIFTDTIAFLVVFAVLVGLAIFVGAPLEPKADPTVTTYIPRPEWYFLFLFRFLSLLKPSVEVVGTIVVPIVAILVLLFLPKLDRNKYRHPIDRPVVTGLTLLVLAAIVFLTIQGATAPAPASAPITEVEIPALTIIQQQGLTVYRDLACSVCHAINGLGGTRGPDLAGVANRLEPSALLSHLQPTPGTSTMPSYTIDNQDLLALATYLETLNTPPTRPVVVPPPLSPGQAAYIAQGCPTCHSINGIGGTTGPDLSSEGAKHDKAFISQFLQNPSVVIPQSKMPAHALSPQDLDAISTYLASLKGGLLSGGPSADAGKTLYDELGCSACHAIRGTGGNLGPDLTDIGNNRDAAFIQKFIHDPKSVSAGASMPPYGNLSDAELQSVALYLLSLSGKAPPPVAGPTAVPAAPTATLAGPTATLAAPSGPTPTQAAAALPGVAVYEANCQACHGPNGQGGAVYGRSIVSAQFLGSRSDAQIRAVIQNGTGRMPGFGGKLSASDIDALIAALRSWKQ